MTFKEMLIAGVAVAGLAFSAGQAVAQEEQAAGQNDVAAGSQADGAAAERAPEDNWLKVCGPLEDGQKACIMRQVVLANGQFIGSFVLRNDPGQENRLLAVATVPVGVLLPAGMTWQIDGDKPMRFNYVVCDPVSCAAQAIVNEAFVNSLKKGATLKLTAKNRQYKDLVVDINLAGFTAVYESEQAVSFDELNKQESSETALERMLQDRAEQIRREKAPEVEASPQ